jgi:hypothetical protein
MCRFSRSLTDGTAVLTKQIGLGCWRTVWLQKNRFPYMITPSSCRWENTQCLFTLRNAAHLENEVFRSVHDQHKKQLAQLVTDPSAKSGNVYTHTPPHIATVQSCHRRFLLTIRSSPYKKITILMLRIYNYVCHKLDMNRNRNYTRIGINRTASVV